MGKKLKERDLVNSLIINLRYNERSKVYVYVDRDCGARRHTRSGWDFLAAKNSRVVFCEAKLQNNDLTDWQRVIEIENKIANNKYAVLRFLENRKVYNKLTGEVIDIDKVNFDFLYGLDSD